MIYTVKEQAILILYCILFGAGIAIVYDMISYYLSKLKIVIRYILEFIFWILLTFIASRFMLKNSDGYLPIYTFVFYTIGILLYFIFGSKQYIEYFDRLNQYTYLFFKRIRSTIIIIILPKELYSYLKTSIIKLGKKAKKIYISKKIKHKEKKELKKIEKEKKKLEKEENLEIENI